MTDKSIDRSRSKIHEMVVRGSEYREEYEFDLYGETVTAILRPLVDDEFLPVAAFLSEHLDMDAAAEGGDTVDEAMEQLEEAREDDDEPIDISKLDEDFVSVMQEAAVMGLAGAFDDDGNEVPLEDDEEKRALIHAMMGGYSVELGGQVLSISGDVRDAEKFRGGRGRVAGSRAE